MPTGYTAIIEEGATFEEFVWRCARAFGSLISMRDHSMDADIPSEFKPDDYHLNQLRKEEARLDELKSLSKKGIEQRTKACNEQRLRSCQESNEKNLYLRRKYITMAAKVEEWEPPTPDHVELKKFMLQQIRESIKLDTESSISQPRYISEEEWLQEEIKRAEWGINYHKKEYNKEVQRAKENTKWLQALRKSVPCKIFKGKR